MEYHDQPMQFISNHFFQVKSKSDTKYRIIVWMMRALTYLPTTLMPLISFLVMNYIYPKITCYVKQYSEIDDKDDFFSLDQLPYANTQLMQATIIQKWKTLHLICLFLTSIVINIILVMLHISSAKKFIEFGNEMLHVEEFLVGPSGYHYLPYMHATLSYFLITAMLIIAIVYLIYKRTKSSLIAMPISVNIIYTLCYFSPTMLLVFIHDPLLTIFTCLISTIGIGIIYSMIWSIGLVMLSRIIESLIPNTWLSFKILICTLTVYTASYSIVYFCILITGMISLGSFSDFQALKNDMIIPLLVGLLTLFVLKPAHNYAKTKLSNKRVEEKTDKIISNNLVDEVHIMIDQVKDSHDNKTEEMDGQSDENTIV